MIKTRMRKVLRDVWSRKIRTFLVSTSIFIGVWGVVAMVSTGEILVNQLEKDLSEDRISMLQAALTLQRGVSVDNEVYLETLRSQPGVTHVEGRAVYPVFWRSPGSDGEFTDGYVAAHTESFDQSYIEPPRLVEGRYPLATAPSVFGRSSGENTIEIAIERRFALENDLEIGDRIEIRILSQPSTLENIPVVTAEIVGIAFQPYGYNSASGTVEMNTVIFADYRDAQFIASFTGLSGLLARFIDFETAEAQEASFAAAVAANTPYTVIFKQTADPAENAAIESTRATNRILVTLAFIALIVSGFLVINVISSIISEQKRQIGAMKSLGATTFDNFFMYAGIALTYGIIGVIPGVLLGIPAGYFAAQGLASQSETIIEEFSVVPSAIILGIIVGLLVPFLASILPVLSGTRVSILDAMTDMGIGGRFGRGRLERIIAYLPVSMSVQQALSNVFQKKGRLALTGTTLTLANGAFMGIFAVFFALSGLVDTTFATFGYQIEISPNEGQNFAQVESLLQDKVDDLQDIEPGINTAISIEGYDAEPITAGPPGVRALGFNTRNQDVIVLDYTEGTGWEEDPDRRGVVLSTRIANIMGKGEGDRVVITANGNTQEFEVIGVANYPFDGVWFEWQQLAEFAGFVGEDGDYYPNRINVILANSEPTSDEVDTKIDEINEILLENGITSDFTNWVSLSELILRIVIILGVVLSLGAFLIALVGGVGLLTSLSISVFERQKEIGVMRSVGATSHIIFIQFLIEGLIVGVVGWLLAIPISLFIRALLVQNLPFETTFEIEYPLITPVVGLIGMIMLVTISSLLPSASAARKTVSDILRYQ